MRARPSIILDPVKGLRDRQRADGTWRLWWEPSAAQRALGAAAVEFDAGKPGHAAREARRLNTQWSGQPQPVKIRGRSVSDLIHAYRGSRFYQDRRATTRQQYDTDLKVIEGKWGPHAVALFDKPTVSAWYETNLDRMGVWRAKALNTMLNILMGHAEILGWRPENSNPCSRIKITTPPVRARVASRAEASALMKAARALKEWDMLAAILLGIAAGQRVTDIREVAPADFYQVKIGTRRVMVWQLTQSKRGRQVDVPLHPAVAPLVRMLISRAKAKGYSTLLVDTVTSKPFAKRRMWGAFDRIRAVASVTVPSVKDLRQQDLRRTFSNLSRAGGSTVDDVADVLGNTAAIDPRLRETYMAAQLATQLRAVEAISLPATGSAKTKRVG
jgi:integrase